MSLVFVLECPTLEPPQVELTDERERHIRSRHPDLLPSHMLELQEAVLNPDGLLPNDYNPNKWALFKWFPELRGGKFIVVQIVKEWTESTRHFIVTAYLDSVPPS